MHEENGKPITYLCRFALDWSQSLQMKKNQDDHQTVAGKPTVF